MRNQLCKPMPYGRKAGYKGLEMMYCGQKHRIVGSYYVKPPVMLDGNDAFVMVVVVNPLTMRKARFTYTTHVLEALILWPAEADPNSN